MKHEPYSGEYTTEYDQCNCPWQECPGHPNTPCIEEAEYAECPCGCGMRAYVGDQCIGKGIHLCKECGIAILDILRDETMMCGGLLSEHVPHYYKPLERIVRNYFKKADEVSMEEGWQDIWLDALGVLSFFHAVLDDKPNKIPLEVIEQVSSHVRKVHSIQSAVTGIKKENHETKGGLVH